MSNILLDVKSVEDKSHDPTSSAHQQHPKFSANDLIDDISDDSGIKIITTGPCLTTRQRPVIDAVRVSEPHSEITARATARARGLSMANRIRKKEMVIQVSEPSENQP